MGWLLRSQIEFFQRFFFPRKLQDFMEEEAELSGSDVGSEDEYDGEDLNEYEEEIIDEELPNEAELGNQIQKFHM